MLDDRDVELTFAGPAGPECIEHIHQLLDRLWTEEPSVADVDQMLFCTAVVEVANNIVEHGRSTQLTLALQVTPSQLKASFVDDGSPAEVDVGRSAMPDGFAESGRGLAIARAVLDEFSYSRTGVNNRWNLIRQRVDAR